MKNLNSILLIGGVGALIYFMMNKSTASKSKTTPSGGSLGVGDVVKKYAPTDWMTDAEKQMISKGIESFKTAPESAFPKSEKELASSLEMFTPRSEQSKSAFYQKLPKDLQDKYACKEEAQKIFDDKSLDLKTKTLLLSLLMKVNSIIMERGQSKPSSTPTSTKDNKNTTQSKEVESFVGVNMI